MRYLSKLTKRLSLGRSSRLIGALLLAACADASGPTDALVHPGEPAELRITTSGSISVSPSTLTVRVGETIGLSASVLDRRGRRIDGATITWASAAPAIATVSSTGRVTGVSTGASSVTATSGSARASVAVTVSAPVASGVPGTVTDLAVADRTNTSLTLSFTTVGNGAGGGASYVMRAATPTLSWGSATNVTSGSCALPITTAAAGSRQFCTLSGLVAGARYQVQLVTYRGTWPDVQAFGALSNIASGTTLTSTTTPPPSPASVASVTLDRGSASITVGTTTTFTATLRDSAGNVLTGRSVTWTSSNTSAATVLSGLTSGLAAGSANITATSEGRSASAALTVTAVVTTPPPPSGGTFFSSSWSTATGSSDFAITDGGTWNNVYCSGRNTTLAVVPGSSVGFTRTANVLRLQELGTTCGMLERINAIPLSTSHYGRMYFRNDETTTRHNHVMTYFPVGTIQTSIWNRSGSPTGVGIRFRTYYAANGSGGVYPTAHWGLGDGSRNIELSNGTWYRYEWHMEYLTPTTYRLWPRIYTADGTVPLYDYTDFWGGDFVVSLAEYYASGGSFGFSNVALARNFGIGNEGPAGGTNSGQYWYHAAIELSTGGWIGR